MENKTLYFKLSMGYYYLLGTKDGYLLIDTGNDYDNKLFESEMKRNSVSYQDIAYIFLTHHHNDHSGLVNFIIEKNPKIKVIMNRHCAELLITGENDKTRGGGFINRRIYYLLKVYRLLRPECTFTFPPYHARACDVVYESDHHDVLRELGIPGSVIYTPGHTIDSACVLMDDGRLFAGDAAGNYLKFAGTKYASVYITDAEEYYKSWEKIIASGAKTIYPIHGNPFSVDKLRENIWRVKSENLAGSML